jgi:hypothetical protein
LWGPAAVPYVTTGFGVVPEMVLHVVYERDDPPIRGREMLVTITLKEFVDGSFMMTPHFHHRRMCTRRVDVLLGLRHCTEATASLVSSEV